MPVLILPAIFSSRGAQLSLVNLTHYRGGISCGFHSLITRPLFDFELQMRGKSSRTKTDLSGKLVDTSAGLDSAAPGAELLDDVSSLIAERTQVL
jgi:hypothetical protein